MARVAITIDAEFPDQAAADPLGTLDEMLRVLSGNGVKATFFVVGGWARANPERVLAIRREGHLIGNHSYSHCSLSRMTPVGITEDLLACERVLTDLGIESRPWFRAPYGELGHDAAGVRKAIGQAGYRHVHWNVDSKDWRPGREAEEVARTTIDGVRGCWPRPATVLFHSWPDAAARALDLALASLRAGGAKFVTVDQIGLRHRAVGRLRAAVERSS